jgi:hypothetical protein
MADDRDLIRALVEASGTNREYVRNAEFKAGVTVLAQLLPSMVQGMAQEAEKRHGERERQINIYERMSTPALLQDLGLGSFIGWRSPGDDS